MSRTAFWTAALLFWLTTIAELAAVEHLQLENRIVQSGEVIVEQADQTIHARHYEIRAGANVQFTAGRRITLGPGFKSRSRFRVRTTGVVAPPDTTAPIPVADKASGYQNQPFTLAISAEAGSILYYTLDGSSPTLLSPSLFMPANIGIQQSGVVKYFAVDAYGNRSAEQTQGFIITNKSADFELDGPVLQVQSPVQNGTSLWSGNTLQVRISSDEEVSILVNHLPATFSANTLDYEATIPVLPGKNEIYVTAKDVHGNTSTLSFSHTLDDAAPVITLLEPVQAGKSYSTGGNALTISGSYEEPNLESITILTDGGKSYQPAVGTDSFSATIPLLESDHLITVRARDKAGRETNASFNIQVDFSFAPQLLQVITPANGGALRGGETIELHGRNFRPGLSATIGGNALLNVVVHNDHYATAQTPAATTKGAVAVKLGTSTLANAFTYRATLQQTGTPLSTDKVNYLNIASSGLISFRINDTAGRSPSDYQVTLTITRNSGTTAYTLPVGSDFSFSRDIKPLTSEGNNTIVIAVSMTGASATATSNSITESYTIFKDTVAPYTMLTNNYLYAYEKMATSEQVSADTNKVDISVNGTIVNTKIVGTRYIATLPLNIGINNVSITATDKAGNQYSFPGPNDQPKTITRIVNANDFANDINKACVMYGKRGASIDLHSLYDGGASPSPYDILVQSLHYLGGAARIESLTDTNYIYPNYIDTNIGEFLNIPNNNGYVIDPNNVQYLSNILKKIVQNKLFHVLPNTGWGPHPKIPLTSSGGFRHFMNLEVVNKYYSGINNALNNMTTNDSIPTLPNEKDGRLWYNYWSNLREFSPQPNYYSPNLDYSIINNYNISVSSSIFPKEIVFCFRVKGEGRINLNNPFTIREDTYRINVPRGGSKNFNFAQISQFDLEQLKQRIPTQQMTHPGEVTYFENISAQHTFGIIDPESCFTTAVLKIDSQNNDLILCNAYGSIHTVSSERSYNSKYIDISWDGPPSYALITPLPEFEGQEVCTYLGYWQQLIPVTHGLVKFRLDDLERQVEIVGLDGITIEKDPVPTNSETKVTLLNPSPGVRARVVDAKTGAPVSSPALSYVGKGNNGVDKVYKLSTLDDAGQFKIIASHPGHEDHKLCRKELAFTVAGCSTCDSGACQMKPEPSLGSLHIRIPVGGTADWRDQGAGLGHLEIHEATPSATLASPQALQFHVTNPLAQVIRGADGWIRQVKTPSHLVDITVLDIYSYKIDAYLADQATGKGSGGLYRTSGTPVASTTIENPSRNADTSRLRLSYDFDGRKKVLQYEYDGQWNLLRGYEPTNGSFLSKERLQKSEDANGDTHETRIVTNPDNSKASDVKLDYANKPFGLVLTRETVNTTPSRVSTWMYYEDQALDGANYGRLKRFTDAQGFWCEYTYDAGGNVLKQICQYQGSLPGQSENQHSVTVNDYTPFYPGDDGSQKSNLPRRVIQQIQGQEVSRSYHAYLPNEERHYRCAKTGAAWDDAGHLLNIERTVATGPFKGKPLQEIRPDGTMTIHQYALQNNGGYLEVVSSGAPDAVGTAISAGTRTETMHLKDGRREWTRTTDIESGLVIASETVNERDELGRELVVQYLDGTVTRQSYNCCEADSFTGRDGITTMSTTDDLGRTILETRGEVGTRNTYDALGRIMQTWQVGKDGTERLLQMNGYDLAGELVDQENAAGNVTIYQHLLPSQSPSGLVENITTNPDGTTRRELSHADGSLVRITGTAVHAISYEYGVVFDTELGTNLQVSKVYQGEDASATQWTVQYSDPLGRTVKSETSGGSSTRSFYNAKGQLWKTTSDGISNLFAYNVQGEQETSAIDINANDNIDYEGPDRIRRSVADITQRGEQTVSRSRQFEWREDGSSASTLTATGLQSLTSLESWGEQFGLTTHNSTTLDGLGGQVVTTTLPDGRQNISTSSNGMVMVSISKDANGQQISRQDYQYDVFDRQSTITDARNGNTNISYNILGQVETVTSPAPAPGQATLSTSTFYDVMGRQQRILKADSTQTWFTYHPTGELKRTWGSRTTPVEYSYQRGQMKTMSTWKDFNADSGKAVTTWNYHPARGLMTGKVYDNGQQTGYEYTPEGRLSRRTWARGVHTNYNYGPGGELLGITYSDSTPAVSYTYKRSGQPDTVSDAMGVRRYAFTIEGLPDSETHESGVFSGLVLDYGADALLRKTSLSVTRTGMSSLAYAYTYDSAARLQSASNGSESIAYAYHANSPLIQSKTFKRNGATVMTTSLSYDKLNRLTQTRTVNAANSQLDVQNYLLNNAHQRVRVDNADGTYWEHTFDELGQVTSGRKKSATGTIVPGFDFNYTADDIGNRKTDTVNAASRTFASNSVNQYTQVGTTPKSYDSDGNITNDGIWTYTYDAENRLTSMTRGTVQRLEFTYDAHGRRFMKKVYSRSNNTWVLASTRYFIYDGWNLLAELDGAFATLKSYLWGLDLSGSEQGAGGVGGLVAMKIHAGSTSYFYTFDGNGNTTAIVNASSGAVTKRYEYGPFGQVLLNNTDTLNNFRFSTKYQDLETNLNYYGYRYYSPDMGRWINRDPIEESGGLNVYGFVGNDGVNWVDPLGNFKVWVHMDIVEDAFKDEIKTTYLSELKIDTARVDLYAFTDEKLHFDNNTFSEGESHINLLMNNVIPKFDKDVPKNIRAKDTVLYYYGQLLHAKQDFWSHSNAIERSLVHTGHDLFSGEYSNLTFFDSFIFGGYDKLAYWYNFDQYETWGDSKYNFVVRNWKRYYRHIDHEILNKDNEGAVEGKIFYRDKSLHQHAYDEALKSTIDTLSAFKKLAPNTWCLIKK